MKKYTYNKTRYNIRVTTVGVFCILILIYALVKLYLFRNYLWFAIVIVCIYQIYNTFIAKAIPSEVELDEHRVSFKAYGKIKSFDFKQVNDFRVRYWPDTHKLFVRINKDNDKGPKGKYWIECRYFNDTLELYNFFIEKECQIQCQEHTHRRMSEIGEHVCQKQSRRQRRHIRTGIHETVCRDGRPQH